MLPGYWLRNSRFLRFLIKLYVFIKSMKYAVENMDYVVEYTLYNVGDRTALKVTLDDRNSFPTQSFDIVKGMLHVHWEKLAPGENGLENLKNIKSFFSHPFGGCSSPKLWHFQLHLRIGHLLCHQRCQAGHCWLHNCTGRRFFSFLEF